MNRFLILSVASVLSLGACASPSTMPKAVDLNFTQMSPVPLNVGTVQVLNASAPSVQAKGVALRNASPAGALERYAAHRLNAAGRAGNLNFVIRQATITSREIMPTGGDWTDNLQLGKPTEHTVTMRVGLELSGTGMPTMKSAYTLERKKTVSAGASLAQRDYEINSLIESMVRDLDAAVMKGLNENMHIVIGPSPMTFGTPMPMNDAASQIPVMLNGAQ